MRVIPFLLQCVLAVCGASLGAASQALPVIPGVSGYGLDTPAGRGGTVYRVNNLRESGAGSLGACIAASGPRVCIFEVSGVIRLTDDLIISKPNITIAGQTAPSPGIVLRGATLRIQASDVLVQHIRVRAGDAVAGPPPINRDSLTIAGSAERPTNNVVIDHCSFGWSLDEMASTWLHWNNVSFVGNIFAEALSYARQPGAGPLDTGGHGYGVLLGPDDGSVSLIGNLLAHNVARNPLSRATRFVFVNNVVYNRATADMQLQSEAGVRTSNAIVGNVFIRGRDYDSARATRPIHIYNEGEFALGAGSRVFLRDNAAQELNGGQWSLVSYSGAGPMRAQFEALTAPVWPAGLVALPTANDTVLDHVLATAGARRTDRDPIDERTIASVRYGTGAIINCVAAGGSAACRQNAGGWPSLGVRTRTLRLPVNPHSVTAGGYTNLEVWLHSLSSALEGDVANGPQPPTEIRVR